MNLQVLTGKVALVTGASRGIGRGIAHVLVENGVTVYITGREHKESNDYKNVMETAAELNKLGCGKCIGVFCDHKNDEDTKKVFDQIKKNEDKLDILVNNAFSMLDLKDELSEKMFWKKDASLMWDKTINVGLRSNYIASCMALELMMPKKKGLIVNISSAGGLIPLFNPLYCVGKEGNDRMAVEMGQELKSHGITVVSLWPGLVRTEILTKLYKEGKLESLGQLWQYSESVEFTGRAIAHLSADKDVIQNTGKILIVAELANKYGFSDIDGKYPPSLFAIKCFVGRYLPSISSYIPNFFRVPKSLATWYYGKF